MVDRIGKGGGPAEPPKTTEGAKPVSTGRTFEVPPTAAEGAKSTAEVGGASGVSPALEQLRAGHIDLEGYVQAKLEEATAHLEGLRPADLEMIRRTLREKMSNDPTLAELARQATGSAPAPPPEDE